MMRRTMLFFVVYGVMLAVLSAGCSRNQPPAAPQLSGPAYGGPGDTLPFKFSAVDPENQALEYGVAWGDTNAVEWSPQYPSGQRVTQTHVFADSGVYHVKVKARDTKQAESGWSDSLNVSVASSARLVGTLLLQTGQSGDIQNSRVQLFVSPDLKGNPTMEVASRQNTTYNSPFEFTDLVEGNYYLIAWKDLNGDGVVSDNDIVGIHGGSYRPGHGGTPVSVPGGKTTDVGDIVMLIYKELKISASGERVSGGTETNLTYSFNYDVTLTSLTITFPGNSPVTDPGAPGAKTGGTTYHSDGWNNSGNPMPTGDHTLEFVGMWEGYPFDIIVTVNIN
jgi:hypothetical protein